MGDGEIYNPTRRYKHFRPRQASRGMKASGVPVNFATLSLYNNSSAPAVLVVRDFSINGTANDVIALSYAQGQIGTSQGKVSALLPSEAVQAGLIASIDTATAYPGDYAISLSSLGTFEWYHDYPFAVVQIGWSLVVQGTTAAHAVTCSILWESISIDELDFFW
jgi:hypothetical protein